MSDLRDRIEEEILFHAMPAGFRDAHENARAAADRIMLLLAGASQEAGEAALSRPAPPIEERERRILPDLDDHLTYMLEEAKDGDLIRPRLTRSETKAIISWLRTSAPAGGEQPPPIQFERELVEKEDGVLEWSEGGEQPDRGEG